MIIPFHRLEVVRVVSLILFLFLGHLVLAQRTNIHGYVVDARSGEVLIGATVKVTSGQGTLTNTAGYFSIASPSASRLTISFIGYVTAQVSIDSLLNRTVRIALEPQAINMAEVTVQANELPSQSIPGTVSIPVTQLKQIPMPLGETDVVKALALTPGITVGTEGTAGLLVRGGSPDQNLIRLDETTLYDQSHLFGFAASFNSDAIKSVLVYKGAFPARFGGRLSSVLDITVRDGNQKQTNKELNVGLVSSRFLVEGPLNQKWRRLATYMVSARSSYLTLFLLPTIISYNKGKSTSYFNYWLYDLNAKLTVQLDSVRRLSVSVFRGHDYWYGWDGGQGERSKFGLDWGNTTGTIRYNQVFTPKLFFSGLVSYSAYQYQTGYTNYKLEESNYQRTNQYGIGSTVRDWTLRGDLEWFATSHHQVRAGLETIFHHYRPSAIRTSFNLETSELVNQPINAIEQSLYLEHEWKPTGGLTLNMGLRNVLFKVPSKTYLSLEPRTSVAIQLPSAVSLNASYSRMRQFVHLLGSNVVGFPNEVWVPATSAVPPQIADQLAFGLSKSLARNRYRLSVEVYKKWMRNLIDVPTGTDLLTEFDQSWQERIEKGGIGQAQGVELFLHKSSGRLNGWISYTWAKNSRRFLTINQGNWFRANYDRRHVAAVTLNYGLSQRIQLSATWQYQSGQPATVPVALVHDPQLGFYPNYIYKDRNNYQTTAYHRLDLSMNFFKTFANKQHRTWTVGVINAYNRQNPLFLTIRKRVLFSDLTNPSGSINGYDTQLNQQSFLPFLPYVSFSRSF